MNYHCDICNYSCIYESHWLKHLKTRSHNNNGIETRIRKKKRDILCTICNKEFTPYNKLRAHILSKHSTKEEREEEFPYYCNFCDFGTFGKCLLDKHYNSKKHQNIILLLNKKSAF